MNIRTGIDSFQRQVPPYVLSALWVIAFAFQVNVASAAPNPQQAAPAKSAPGSAPQESKPATPREKAWDILRKGLMDESADKRARAVNALGLLPDDPEAESAAKKALKDEKPNVRVAGAAALGSMRASDAKEELEAVLNDAEPAVVLTAANSLLLLKDDVGYDVYYDVLTGEKRASKGLVKEQLDTLKDKKKLAQMGFEQGIGFIPFAGIGYEFFKTVTKNDSSPVRAAAAKKLAHDPKPDSAEALVKAVADKSWAVRAAALEAIALRGDPSLVSKITAGLNDEKDVVRFTAAACVVHLSEPAVASAVK
jgi:HEAT repeat protein